MRLGLDASEQRRAAALVVAVAALLACAVLAVSFTFDVREVADGAHARAFGLTLSPCPGCGYCGMSRAFAALSHLDLRGAIGYNPFVLLHYPLALLLALGGPWLARRLWRDARRR